MICLDLLVLEANAQDRTAGLSGGKGEFRNPFNPEYPWVMNELLLAKMVGKLAEAGLVFKEVIMRQFREPPRFTRRMDFYLKAEVTWELGDPVGDSKGVSYLLPRFGKKPLPKTTRPISFNFKIVQELKRSRETDFRMPPEYVDEVEGGFRHLLSDVF
jgi:hypothetical protein